MSDTPVAYYRLDDAGSAMYDATNNRLNGAYGTGITKRTTSLVSNTADPSASFPGGTWSANSIATVPPNALLKPNAVSVEGWVKETAANSGGILDLVSFGPESGAGYALQISATNTLAFTVRTTGTPATVTVSGSTVLTAGTVYHVVATFDGETAKLYLNGTVDGSSVGTGNVNYAGTGTYGLAIGATQSTSRMVFNGTLDEVAVYDHALNASRVSSHYGVSAFSASQTGPAHILTWAYYDNAHNTGVSVQYMLRHVDWVEASEPYPTTPDRVNAFRAAGGMHSAWYADPGISYHCNSPFGPTSLNTPGSCSPAITGYVSESDWLHGTSAPNYAGAGETPRPGFTPSPTGARMHTETSTSVLYGERMNPGSSEARTAFGTYTTNLVSASGRLDVVLMDDSSPHYRTEEFNFEFGTTPSEYAGTGGPAAWNNDVRALACAAARPVVFNGASFDPNDSTTASDDGAMYRSPCVAGAMIEGAFVGSPPRSSLNVGASWNTFLAKADKALLAQSYGKLALILNEQSCAYGTSCFDPTGDRVYGLAGIWLVYDPRFTVAWSLLSGTDPNMADGDGNPDSLVAEFGIVPTQPYTSAGLDVKALQVTNGHTASGGPAGGPFVREFTQCYQDGASIGACAVVMNAEDTTYTSGGVVNMPSLAHGPYAHALVLNDAPADNGGSATWTGTVPTTLQPTTAVILKKT
jgi:hypothetical protein